MYPRPHDRDEERQRLISNEIQVSTFVGVTGFAAQETLIAPTESIGEDDYVKLHRRAMTPWWGARGMA